MKFADRKVYIESHFNWNEAIVRAAFKYENIKTTEHLDEVYNEYLMLRELGVSKEKIKEDDILMKSYIFCNKKYQEIILKGRELAGEPLDFNF